MSEQVRHTATSGDLAWPNIMRIRVEDTVWSVPAYGAPPTLRERILWARERLADGAAARLRGWADWLSPEIDEWRDE